MKETLMSDLKEAMKNKDIIAKNTIQSIRAAILQEEKDFQKELTDTEIEAVIVKEKKKRTDALEQFKKANREDLIYQTEMEIKILEGYLPEQLSEEETEEEVIKIINTLNAQSMKDMGSVMKRAKELFGSAVDGKLLSTIVKNKLNELEVNNK